VAWSAAEWPNHSEAEATGAEEEKGRRRWRSSGDAGLGLGFRWVGAAFCRAAEPHWRAGLVREGRRRSHGAVAHRGRRRRGGRRRGAARWGQPVSGRGGTEARSGGVCRAEGTGPWCGPRGKKGKWGKGPKGKRERRGEGKTGLGQRVWAASFPYSFPFSFSTLKPFKPFHLNSNKFEFKPNTNKTMHQHEYTSKLSL
jgi:hypothetical protein